MSRGEQWRQINQQRERELLRERPTGYGEMTIAESIRAGEWEREQVKAAEEYAAARRRRMVA